MPRHGAEYVDQSEMQQRWHPGKPLGRPEAPCLQKTATPRDWPFYAAVMAIFITAVCYTASDKGIYHQSLQTEAQLLSHDSKGQYQLRLHSTVTAVDTRRGSVSIEVAGNLITGDHNSYCGDGGAGWHYQLVLGSTANTTDQLVLPACTAAAQQPIIVTLPLKKPANHSSHRGYLTQLFTRLQRAPGSADDTGRQWFSSDMLQDTWPGGPVVSWSATWTANNMQVAVQRLPRYHGGLRLAAEAAAGGWSTGFQGLLARAFTDQFGSDVYGRQDEVVYVLQLTQSSWCRIIQMTAALLQVLAVGYCLVVLLGHVLCALLLQRLLCNRAHGVWQ